MFGVGDALADDVDEDDAHPAAAIAVQTRTSGVRCLT
jgi:hypothetical protein